MSDGGPAWADAIVICPWTIYLCYGDEAILAQCYGAMNRFMDFITRESPGCIRCAPEYEGWPGFGDWLSINANTPRDLIGTAFLAYDAALMAQIADVLGKNARRGEVSPALARNQGGIRSPLPERQPGDSRRRRAVGGAPEAWNGRMPSRPAT